MFAVELADVERKLKRFERSDHASVLKAYRTRARQEREANRQFDGVGNAARRVSQLAGDIELENLPEGVATGDTEADRDYRSALRTLDSAVGKAIDELQATAARLREASRNQREALSNGAWAAGGEPGRRPTTNALSRI